MVALGAVAVLSIMDAVMKHLVLAIGIFAVSVWRAAANLIVSAGLYLPRRQPWPSRPTLKVHVTRGVVVTVMAFLFFWGIGRVPLAQAIALTFIAPLLALLLAAMFSASGSARGPSPARWSPLQGWSSSCWARRAQRWVTTSFSASPRSSVPRFATPRTSF